MADEQPFGGERYCDASRFTKLVFSSFIFEDATERKSRRLKDRSITEAHDEAPNLRTSGTHNKREIHETEGIRIIVQDPKAND